MAAVHHQRIGIVDDRGIARPVADRRQGADHGHIGRAVFVAQRKARLLSLGDADTGDDVEQLAGGHILAQPFAGLRHHANGPKRQQPVAFDGVDRGVKGALPALRGGRELPLRGNPVIAVHQHKLAQRQGKGVQQDAEIDRALGQADRVLEQPLGVGLEIADGDLTDQRIRHPFGDVLQPGIRRRLHPQRRAIDLYVAKPDFLRGGIVGHRQGDAVEAHRPRRLVRLQRALADLQRRVQRLDLALVIDRGPERAGNRRVKRRKPGQRR